VWVRESERGATVSAESGGKAEAKSGRGELRMAEPGKGLGEKKGACVGRYERESGPTGGRGMKRGLQTCERVTGEAENFVVWGRRKKTTTNEPTMRKSQRR